MSATRARQLRRSRTSGTPAGGLDDPDALATLCGECRDCLTSGMGIRRHAARSRPDLRDVVRLTSIKEPGDAHGRLPFVDVPDHRRVTPAQPQRAACRSPQPAFESHDADFGQAEENGGRSCRVGGPGIHGSFCLDHALHPPAALAVLPRTQAKSRVCRHHQNEGIGESLRIKRRQ